MEYKNFVKKLPFPRGFKAPKKLKYDNLTARPISRTDVDADVDAINSSLKLIRGTRKDTWPLKPVDKSYSELNIAWHEREFRDGRSFAYVVYNDLAEYIGCFYLYPMGYRIELTEELLDCDVDVSWWVTSDAYQEGYYQKMFEALQEWMGEFPADRVYYSNTEMPTAHTY